MAPSSPRPVPAAVNGRIELEAGRYRLEAPLWSRAGELSVVGVPGAVLEWPGDATGRAAIEGQRLTLTDLTLVSLGNGDLVDAKESLTCERVTFEASASQWGTAVQVHGKARLVGCTWRWQLGHLVSVFGTGKCEVTDGEATGRHFGFIARDESTVKLRRCHVGPTAVGLASAVGKSRLTLEDCRAEQLQGAALDAEGYARVTARDVVLEGGLRCGAQVTGSAHLEWTGGALRGFDGCGLEVRGEAKVTLRDATVERNAWAGLVADELAQVTASGLTLGGNRFGVIASGACILSLSASKVEGNTERGLDIQDQASLTAKDVTVGPHPEGACVSWHLARTEGVEFERSDFPLEQRLAWVQRRLERPAEHGPSRRALLASLPAVLADVPAGPWFAARLLEDEREVVDTGWPAVLAWLGFEAGAEVTLVKATLGLQPVGPVLALTWRVSLRGGRALFVEPDGLTAWTGTTSGRVQGWSGGAEVASWTVDGPVAQLHAAFDRVATAGQSLALFLRQGTLVQTWSFGDEAPVALRVVSAGAVDVCVMDTSGHPTDRLSHRVRYRVAKAERQVLATGQSAPPLDALGAEGVDWEATPVPAGQPGPGLRCDGWSVTFTAADGAQLEWRAPERVVAWWLGTDAAMLVTENELLRVELRHRPQ